MNLIIMIFDLPILEKNNLNYSHNLWNNFGYETFELTL